LNINPKSKIACAQVTKVPWNTFNY
jgi:hypothetical protein